MPLPQEPPPPGEVEYLSGLLELDVDPARAEVRAAASRSIDSRCCRSVKAPCSAMNTASGTISAAASVHNVRHSDLCIRRPLAAKLEFWRRPGEDKATRSG